MSGSAVTRCSEFVACGVLSFAAFVFVCVAVFVGCATSVPSRAPSILTGKSLQQARKTFDALRVQYAPKSETMRVSVQFSSTMGLGRVNARGAIARQPPNRFRMILLGPGGMTAFDMLLRDALWRVEVPSKRVKWQGVTSVSVQQLKGFPVGFLRWWFLRPLSGEFEAAYDYDGTTVFVVKDAEARMRIQQQQQGLIIERNTEQGSERIVVKGPGCSDAIYENDQSKVRVNVHCEQIISGADRIDERMFE